MAVTSNRNYISEKRNYNQQGGDNESIENVVDGLQNNLKKVILCYFFICSILTSTIRAFIQRSRNQMVIAEISYLQQKMDLC